MRSIWIMIALGVAGCSAGTTTSTPDLAQTAPAATDSGAAHPGRMRMAGRGAHRGQNAHECPMMNGAADEVAPDDAGAATGAADAHAGHDAEARGREIFIARGNCSTCHGRDGAGTALAPDLTDDDWLHADGSVAAIRRIVMHGIRRPLEHPAPMPPKGGAALSMQDVHDVADYVAGLND